MSEINFENQMDLSALGIETVSEEKKAIIKKIMKLTGESFDELEKRPQTDLEKYLEQKEEEQKRVKAVTRRLRKLELNYNQEWSIEANEAFCETEEKKAKAEKEKQKKIGDLTAKLKKLNLEYDDSKSFEENNKRYREEVDAAEDRRKNPKWKYPFRIYFKGNDIQEPDHIFEIDKEYTAKEVSKLLLQDGYKEFSGSVSFTYDSEDNMLIPDFKSQRHG